MTRGQEKRIANNIIISAGFYMIPLIST